ncbi:MAG TPA: aspartyl protease family protein [Pyrinomonadaceae bacterium]|jgi:clan AA aspartic protease|nr:aspartyl protease family protein [Pyrinomonadaceae bacterium]
MTLRVEYISQPVVDHARIIPSHDMGEVKVKVELENAVDRELVLRGQLSEPDVRKITTRLLVDSGAIRLVLPQDQVEALGLRQISKIVVRYADERKEERPVAGVVTVKVGDRLTDVDCIVGPPNSEPLLGQEILEVLDLLVDCPNQQLIPRPESPLLPELKVK